MEPATLDLASKYVSPCPVPRIVVAILDTGYDPNAIFFSSPGRPGRIRHFWKDFAGQELSPVDTDGHGTHVVSLAMKIAPAADIYVARVATNSQELQSASKNIAEVLCLTVITHPLANPAS